MTHCEREASISSHANAPRVRRWMAAGLTLLVLGGLAPRPAAWTQEPAPARGTQELVKLIAPESGVVLTMDDLRGQAKALLGSPLAAEFWKLPMVKDWQNSDKFRQLETAQDQIEGLFQVSAAQVRDKILGDAVVFALHLPPNANDPSQARGILVLKASDPGLLRRVIDVLNSTQKSNGEIAAVINRRQGETDYKVREFPPGSNRPNEAYVAFEDGVFALSNSETLIQDLIDRKARKAGGAQGPGSGIPAVPRFEAVDRGLPARALARLYVDPRMVETLIKNAPRPKSPGEAVFRRYLAAHESMGAALVASDQRLSLEVVEVFEPSRFRDLLGPLAGSATASASPPAPELDRVPASALAVGAIQANFAGVYEFLRRSVPERELPRVVNVESLLSGLMLGQDLRTRILPALGPRVLVSVEAPAGWDSKAESDSGMARNFPFPAVAVLELSAEKPPSVSIATAIDNGLRSLLSLAALDNKHAGGRASVIAREVAGATIRTLDPPVPAAYAVDHAGRRLVVGNSASAVERYLARGSDARAGERFRQLRAQVFPKASSYFCVDLAAVEAMITAHRGLIADGISRRENRPSEGVARDLDQLAALSRLFDAGYVTSRLEGPSPMLFHSLGLIPRPPGAEADKATRH